MEIDGYPGGEARTITDVLIVAAAAGISVHDLDDPDVVRWAGGGKHTWKVHWGRARERVGPPRSRTACPRPAPGAPACAMRPRCRCGQSFLPQPAPEDQQPGD